MAEAIIGAQMRAHNPEPCPELADPVGCTGAPVPQVSQLLPATPTVSPLLLALIRTALTTCAGTLPAGILAVLQPVRPAPRRGCTASSATIGIARS